MHVTKKGELKPSLFSHVLNKGCSVQRDSIASDREIRRFVRGFLGKKRDRVWLGTVSAKVADLRKILAPDAVSRALCIYDTAEWRNPAHAEMCRTRHIVEEADEPELRGHLLKAFGGGTVLAREKCRDGSILAKVRNLMRA
jgi:hypothetical protein